MLYKNISVLFGEFLQMHIPVLLPSRSRRWTLPASQRLPQAPSKEVRPRRDPPFWPLFPWIGYANKTLDTWNITACIICVWHVTQHQVCGSHSPQVLVVPLFIAVPCPSVWVHNYLPILLFVGDLRWPQILLFLLRVGSVSPELGWPLIALTSRVWRKLASAHPRPSL